MGPATQSGDRSNDRRQHLTTRCAYPLHFSTICSASATSSAFRAIHVVPYDDAADALLRDVIDDWVDRGILGSLRSVVAEVWPRNLDRHEPDIGDDRMVLGVQSSRNVRNLGVQRLQDQGIDAAVVDHSLQVKHAGRCCTWARPGRRRRHGASTASAGTTARSASPAPWPTRAPTTPPMAHCSPSGPAIRRHCGSSTSPGRGSIAAPPEPGRFPARRRPSLVCRRPASRSRSAAPSEYTDWSNDAAA